MEDEENIRKMKNIVELFESQIRTFIEIFVVGKRSKLLRTPSTYFVKGLWEAADISQKDNIFNIILSVPMQSSSAALISFILKHKASTDNSSELQSNLNMKDVFEFVKKSLNKANDLIFSHQNLELYSGLYPLVGNSKKPNPFSYTDGGSLFTGSSKPTSNNANIFIFEREPCMKCFVADLNSKTSHNSETYSLQNVNDIKTEMKSNEQSQVYKLASAMAIKEVSLNMYELKGSMRVNEVSIYTNCSQTADLSAIKRDKSVWTFIMTMKVSEEKGEKKCRFPVPITACNLMFEFHVVKSNKTSVSANKPDPLYSNPYGGGYDSYGGFQNNSNYQVPLTISVNNNEVLNCPRCHIIVEDSHGVCNSCRDNAFQCTYCHNINYENLEAFLCNECGQSRYGKFEFAILARPDFAVEKIKNEKMKAEAERNLESISTTVSSNKLNDRRESLLSNLKMLVNAEGTSPINDIQALFNESVILYQSMMKSVENFKSLKKEILEYEEAKRGDNNEEDERNTSSQDNDTEEFSGCFGCAFNFLNVLLNFINDTASISEFNSLYLQDDFIHKIYSENLSMFSSHQRNVSRMAICKIVSKDTEACLKLMKMIEYSILQSPKTSVLHSSKDRDDSVHYQMLLMVLMKKLHHKYEKENKNKKDPTISDSYSECLKLLLRVLLSSIEYGQKSAPIAGGLIVNCLQKIYDLIKSEALDLKPKKVPSTHSPDRIKHVSSSKNFKSTPIENALRIGQLSKSESKNFENLEMIVKCLLMRTSQKCRSLSVKILTSLVAISDNNYYRIIDLLENYMDDSLQNEEVSEQYFEILNQLLNKEKIIEIVKKNQENEDLYTGLLSKLFDQIKVKCEQLEKAQKKKERLGIDGLYMEINQGKALGEILNIVTHMIQVDFIKKEFKSGTYTYITIKSLLSIRKLFLLKNKTLIQCEKEINKLFKEINSDSEEDKEKFLLACIKLSQECDKQEITFLYQNIKNIIDPVKIIPNYQLNLNKNPNHEIYLRGRMAKNPYSIKDLGDTMRDVLEKICLEHEMSHATELIEMIVAKNIVVPELPIHLVYEKVWYPYLYKQRNPDEYEVPPIETVDNQYKIPMDLMYRLAGVDGEASENRVEELNDEDELSKDPERKYALALTLSQKIEGTDKSGLSIMFNDFKNVQSIKRDNLLLSSILPLLT